MQIRALPQLSLQVLKGRWMVAVVSFYILSFSGATYIFSIYSGAIKTALGYNQQTIDTLGFFKDLGANVGILSGLLNEVLPAWVVLAVGAGMNLFGYLMIWMAVTKRIAKPPVGHMYLFMCMGANSQTFANTGVLVTCVKNFPHSRGVVLGLLKGFVGLSGAIFTQFYHALYGQDTRGVILLIGWLPSLVSLLFMFFVRPMKPQVASNEEKHFLRFLYLALLLAGFLMLIIIVENQVPLSSTIFQAMGAITLLLVMSNICIAVVAELETGPKVAARVDEKLVEIAGKKQEPIPQLQQMIIPPLVQPQIIGDHHKESIMSEAAEDHHEKNSEKVQTASADHKQSIKFEASEDGEKVIKNVSEGSKPSVELPLHQHHHDLQSSNYRPGEIVSAPKIAKKPSFFSNWPERGDDFTIPQALLSLDMWILFVSLTCGVGATLTAIDNMGQIGASLGYSTISISTFVSLISIWNFLGRVISGFVSEWLLQRYRFPRTLVLTIVLALACIGHLLIAFPAPGSLYIASILVGLCFGAQWPVLFAVISELFGLKYYATLYNLGGAASPLGSYLLNVRVAGYLYDREARRQQESLLSTTAISSSNAGAYAPSPMNKIQGSDLMCTGPQCFRMTFLIMTAVSLFGSMVSIWLVLRTRKFYSQDIYARFHKQEEKLAKDVDQAEIS